MMEFSEWWEEYSKQNPVNAHPDCGDYYQKYTESVARAAWEECEAKYRPLYDAYIIRHGDVVEERTSHDEKPKPVSGRHRSASRGHTVGSARGGRTCGFYNDKASI
jgi:hypothetical protein